MAREPLHIQTYFVERGQQAEDLFHWSKRDSRIKNRRGEVFFSMKGVEAPESWSQQAVDIAASKYFRKSGVPGAGHETSVRQIVERVVQAIVSAGLKQKSYFKSRQQAEIFANELKFILWSQRGAFNSPVWFNAGLWEAYGIQSPSEHFAWNAKKNSIQATRNAYEHPQCSACFIQKVEDSIEGIFELAKTEAKLFKYGSGTGTNFSNLRSKYEPLSSGGASSGVISFLEVLDKGAGAIKSGGTTRRAAKMVILDVDHPEILEFIEWKMQEERKAQMLIAGGLGDDFEGVAYRSVSGQNSNNSVRVTDRFMRSVEADKNWKLRARQTRKALRELPAREVWKTIAHANWVCADPGIQFHDTINAWHTCPQSEAIYASNPCSEYMFLNDSACNLASVNLVKFLDPQGQFDFEGYIHTARMLFIAQEILVDYSSYPTAQIAQNSHDYRPLGLGFANLGSLLMRKALAYDSDEARAWAGALTAILTGTAYRTSIELARAKGPFVGYRKNRTAMLSVMKKHEKALAQVPWQILPKSLKVLCQEIWQEVLVGGIKNGFRNAQATVIAPTGTISFLMDCDTTGIEPDFSLLKFKKMTGGGEIQIINQSVRKALQVLHYSAEQIQRIEKHIEEHGDVEGASDLRPADLAIFDCATAVPGRRVLRPECHIYMMAAVQCFVSGAISKTVNLPSTATEKDISDIYFMAWKSGLKAVSIYRDNSKQSQPLNLIDQARPVGAASSGRPGMRCPECGGDTVLTSGCYRCPNCGTTVGCG